MRHLLVIGAQRCGTTYLHSVLDAHPEIAMARPARPEPKAFLRPDIEERGLDWYHAQYFAHAEHERLFGEKSTSYIEHPDAASAAAKLLGAAGIVALLRDPVARAVSNWQFSTASGFEDRPLRQALTENLTTARSWDASATSVSPYAYLERGRYAAYLDAWYCEFGDDVHVRFFEELVGRPDAVADLYAVLGVAPEFEPDSLHMRVNESTEVPPPVDDDVLLDLREYFSASDTSLRDLLGRALPWDPA